MGNQMYAVGWLVERLDWEDTLAGLRLRAERDAEPAAEAAAPPVNRRAPVRSPIRGMSRRALVLKMRA